MKVTSPDLTRVWGGSFIQNARIKEREGITFQCEFGIRFRNLKLPFLEKPLRQLQSLEKFDLRILRVYKYRQVLVWDTASRSLNVATFRAYMSSSEIGKGKREQ